MVRNPPQVARIVAHMTGHSCKILRDATPRSLVILDGESQTCVKAVLANRHMIAELGRGTSTYVSLSTMSQNAGP